MTEPQDPMIPNCRQHLADLNELKTELRVGQMAADGQRALVIQKLETLIDNNRVFTDSTSNEIKSIHARIATLDATVSMHRTQMKTSIWIFETIGACLIGIVVAVYHLLGIEKSIH